MLEYFYNSNKRHPIKILNHSVQLKSIIALPRSSAEQFMVPLLRRNQESCHSAKTSLLFFNKITLLSSTFSTQFKGI